MELFTDIRVILCLLACVLMHLLVAVMPRAVSVILGYINIAMHAAMVVLLAFFGKSIEEAVLVYLISLFVYTLSQLIRYRVALTAERRDDGAAKEEGVR